MQLRCSLEQIGIRFVKGNSTSRPLLFDFSTPEQLTTFSSFPFIFPSSRILPSKSKPGNEQVSSCSSPSSPQESFVHSLGSPTPKQKTITPTSTLPGTTISSLIIKPSPRTSFLREFDHLSLFDAFSVLTSALRPCSSAATSPAPPSPLSPLLLTPTSPGFSRNSKTSESTSFVVKSSPSKKPRRSSHPIVSSTPPDLEPLH